MYAHTNFPTKKALKEAVARSERVTYFQPGPFGGNARRDGRIALAGPHYTQPHRWYAECEARDGLIVRVC